MLARPTGRSDRHWFGWHAPARNGGGASMDDGWRRPAVSFSLEGNSIPPLLYLLPVLSSMREWSRVAWSVGDAEAKLMPKWRTQKLCVDPRVDGWMALLLETTRAAHDKQAAAAGSHRL